MADIDQDLRPALAASCAVAELKRFATAEAAPVMERTPADELRQCLSILSMEVEHPRPDKDLQRQAIARILKVAERLERGER